MVEKERMPCPFTLTMESSYLEYKYKTYKHQVELRGIPSYGGGGNERNQGSVGRALGTCKYILAHTISPTPSANTTSS